MPVGNRMTWTLTIAAGFGLGIAGQASAQAVAKKPQAKSAAATTPAPVDPATARAKAVADLQAMEKAEADMTKLLGDWEAKSRKVQSLQVEFDRFDQSRKYGTIAFRGQALLKSPDLACLEQTKCKLDVDGKPLMKTDPVTKLVAMELESDPDQRIVCTGTEVLQFQWDTKVIFVYPLNKDIRQKALQEGPLPFLFNMKAAEVKRRYKMSLYSTTPDYNVIHIVPVETIDKDSFEQAYLWLGKADFLPHQLKLFKITKEVSTYSFTKIAANRDLQDMYFHPDTKLAGWQVKVNPTDDQQQAQAPAPGPVKPGAVRRAPAQPQQGMNPTGRPR